MRAHRNLLSTATKSCQNQHCQAAGGGKDSGGQRNPPEHGDPGAAIIRHHDLKIEYDGRCDDRAISPKFLCSCEWCQAGKDGVGHDGGDASHNDKCPVPFRSSVMRSARFESADSLDGRRLKRWCSPVLPEVARFGGRVRGSPEVTRLISGTNRFTSANHHLGRAYGNATRFRSTRPVG